VVRKIRGYWRWRKLRRQRQHLEYLAYAAGDPRWRKIKEENEIFGIWR